VLFDAQRPKVEHWAGANLLIEIVDGTLSKAKVRKVEQSGNDVLRGDLPLHEWKDRRRNKQRGCKHQQRIR
jgi:hypothetical protein